MASKKKLKKKIRRMGDEISGLMEAIEFAIIDLEAYPLRAIDFDQNNGRETSEASRKLDQIRRLLRAELEP